MDAIEFEVALEPLEEFCLVSDQIIELLLVGIRNQSPDLAEHIDNLKADGARLILLSSANGIELVAFGDSGPIDGPLLAFTPGMKVESKWTH